LVNGKIKIVFRLTENLKSGLHRFVASHAFVEHDKTNKNNKNMNTPINQLVPKIREKLAVYVGDIKRYNDEILADSVKTVIQFGKLDGKTLNGDGSAINPAIAENSEEERQLILEVCLLLLGSRLDIPPSIIDSLEAELHKIKNGEILFSGR
jgi:hypothetical protein